MISLYFHKMVHTYPQLVSQPNRITRSFLNYQRWFCSRILSWWTLFFCFEFNPWVVLIVTLAKKRCPTGRDCALIMKLGMIRNIFRKFEIIKITDAICILTAQSWKVCLKWWYTQLRLSQHQLLRQGYLIWTWL